MNVDPKLIEQLVSSGSILARMPYSVSEGNACSTYTRSVELLYHVTMGKRDIQFGEPVYCQEGAK